MDFSNLLPQRKLSFSSIGTHIHINLFICVLIWTFFDIDFDNQRLFFFVYCIWYFQLILERIKLISQNYGIIKSYNFLTRLIFIVRIISLMIFAIVFYLSFIIAWFIFVEKYKILDFVYLPIIIGIFLVIIIIDKDSRLFRLVNYLTKFSFNKIPKTISFFNSILGEKYFQIRSLFILFINIYTLISVIGSLFVLLILSVILYDRNNLTTANIVLYLLTFSIIASGIRIFIEIKLILKANKLYRQGNELFKQKTEISRIQAIEIFEQALLLYQKTNYQIWAGITLNNIGLVYDSLEEKQTALDYFHQSLSLFQEMKNFLGEAMILNNIALVYNTLEEKRITLDYFNQCLDLSRTIKDREAIANTLYNLAVFRYEKGNFSEALINIKSAINELDTPIIAANISKSYFTKFQKYYQFYIDLLIQLHKQNPKQGYDMKANEVRKNLNNIERNITRNSANL